MTLEKYQSPPPRPPATSLVTFAFVTPVYNTADDIDATMAAMSTQTLSAKEIIVIDDGSIDGTRAALQKWEAHPSVTVLEHDHNRGASAARNSGLKVVTAEVVVFMDGDDTPPPDFLERLSALYECGFDCVSVESRGPDGGTTVARFLEAEHVVSYGPANRTNLGWTAGFSCRRRLAESVGFPEALPGCGGEDGEFFRRLIESGARPAADFAIVVTRGTPTTWTGFWRQGTRRGRPIPYVDVHIERRSLIAATARRALAALRSLVRSLLILPNLASAAERTKESPRRWRDFASFWVLCHIRTVAIHRGAWESLYRLWRERTH
jgi:glycosyltransferase involved in cell wall biosynthesis